MSAEPSSASSSPRDNPQPTLRPTTLPSSDKPTTGAVTVRGTVVEGVEGGCMLLRSEGGTDYLLLGGDRTLIVAGRSLEVEGQPQPGLMTTCQQGTPFQVTAIRSR